MPGSEAEGRWEGKCGVAGSGGRLKAFGLGLLLKIVTAAVDNGFGATRGRGVITGTYFSLSSHLLSPPRICLGSPGACNMGLCIGAKEEDGRPRGLPPDLAPEV